MILRILYTVLFYCLLPAIGLRLLWRARKVPAYAQRWRERLGYFAGPESPIDLWVHSVSLGEVIACEPLVKCIQQHHPQWRIAITTTTPTGSARTRQIFGEQVFHVYVPLDLPGAIKRFLHRTQPRRLLIMETELWPNLIYYSAQANIPIMIGNARLSEKSMRGYRWLRALLKEPLQCLAQVAAQSSADAERFCQLGVPKARVKVLGNIKFDIQVPPGTQQQGMDLRRLWGADRSVVMAASTHPGEEEQVLAAWKTVKKNHPGALLLLVPRHPERCAQVQTLCEQSGFSVVLKTALAQSSSRSQIDILLGNTMGEMLAFYAASDITFVGGSLVPHGGHNLLEPAALRIPIISGPHTHNFRAIMALFQQAVILVSDSKALSAAMIKLLTDKQFSTQLTQRATKIMTQNQGAVEQHAKMLMLAQHLSSGSCSK